jgi:hypothetical protein
MSHAATSVFFFGIYLALLGGLLIAVPNVLLAWVGLPAANGTVGRVIGTLVVIIGYLCIRAARAGRRAFFHWSIHTRCWVLVCFTSYVVLDDAPWTLLLFGILDFLGAAWTAHALSSESTGRTRGPLRLIGPERCGAKTCNTRPR